MRAGMALSPLRAGSNVNWRTASRAAASSASPADPTTFASVSVPSAAIVSSRSTAAPSGGVPSGRFASTNFATRGGVNAAAGCAAASGAWAWARGAATAPVSSASALATSVHLFDLVPGISASARSFSQSRASGDPRETVAASPPRPHPELRRATAVRPDTRQLSGRARAGPNPPLPAGGMRGATPS
jgi:hypothetical protein